MPILRKTETEVVVARYLFPDGRAEHRKPDVLDRKQLEQNGVASVGEGLKHRTYWLRGRESSGLFDGKVDISLALNAADRNYQRDRT